MDTKYLIETTKRMRVGGTGPKRHQLKFFQKLGEAPLDVINELNEMLDNDSRDDIMGDSYGISKGVNCDKVFNTSGYRQLLLQVKPDNHVGLDVDEYQYTSWRNQVKVTDWLKHYFHNVYRFRMSEMHEEHQLNWHIDTCTSYMCRAQICLNDNDSVFEFRGRDGTIHSFTMKPGELWFINTGWNHRVVTGTKPRRVAIFGYHFDDVIDQQPLFIGE